VKLTRAAATVGETDIETLRAQGLSDTDVSDAIQVIGYFNYVTRIADGVGIGAEPEWEASPSSSAEGPIHP
jgi:alkylhydroperoxidase family enzyme